MHSRLLLAPRFSKSCQGPVNRRRSKKAIKQKVNAARKCRRDVWNVKGLRQRLAADVYR